jgi:hypothetical protein
MVASAYSEMEAYIRDAAIKRGINPDIAVRVAQAEALNVFDPTKPDRGGDEGSSFGPFQLHYAGMSKSMPNAGLGDEFTAATGLDARDPSTWRQQVDFSLDHAKRRGWGAWMGAQAAKIGDWQGIKTDVASHGGPSEGAGRTSGSPVATTADPAADAAAQAAAYEALNKQYSDLLASQPKSTITEQPQSLLADTMASSVSGRRDSGGGGLTPSVADQEAAPLTDLAPSATPEAAPAAPVQDMPAASALADLFKVGDIGLANMTDPLTGTPRLLRTRRAYG